MQPLLQQFHSTFKDFEETISNSKSNKHKEDNDSLPLAYYFSA